MRIPDESENKLEINIVPMIDVIFSILAFFIISTLFLTQSQGLPVDLPQASNTQQQTKTEITVTVQEDGKIAFNEEEVSLEEVVTRVKQAAANSQETIVIMKADEAVSHGEVVTVMDNLRGIEGVKLAIATTKPSE
ncbi:MAG: ExbD/TolR family protein [Halothece sp.]